MKEDKYNCPDVDCGYTNFEAGECPQCGLQLEKIKGEDFYGNTDEGGGDVVAEPMVTEFNDDPEDISWYSDEPAGI